MSNMRDYVVTETMRQFGAGKYELMIYNVITSLDKDALLQMLYWNLAMGAKNKSLVMLIYLLLLL